MSAIRAAAVTNTARVAGATGQLINGLQSLRIVTAVILGTKLHKYGESRGSLQGETGAGLYFGSGSFLFYFIAFREYILCQRYHYPEVPGLGRMKFKSIRERENVWNQRGYTGFYILCLATLYNV